jgi:RecA/RadA recombinase
VYNDKDIISTPVPAINIALSGDPAGGLTPGLLQIAGPSKHFKSAFTLLIASSYLKKYPDAVLMFYDSEFGTPESYFTSFDIPKDRVLHTPILDIEEFKHDIMTQLAGINRGDRVCIVVDSIGNLASKKEVEDAVSGKSAVDMTRAKALKSLGRMVTGHLTLKDIPMIAVNHTYKTMEMFSKDVVSGGTGMYLSSDNIWIVGRQQDKDAGELQGYNFIIKIEKSRHVREGSKIPINVTFEGGINKWSGLFDIAMDLGYIKQAKQGWYTVDGAKNFRRSDVEGDSDFWKNMLLNSDFKQAIISNYKVATTKLLGESEE